MIHVPLVQQKWTTSPNHELKIRESTSLRCCLQQGTWQAAGSQVLRSLREKLSVRCKLSSQEAAQRESLVHVNSPFSSITTE